MKRPPAGTRARDGQRAARVEALLRCAAEFEADLPPPSLCWRPPFPVRGRSSHSRTVAAGLALVGVCAALLTGKGDVRPEGHATAHAVPAENALQRRDAPPPHSAAHHPAALPARRNGVPEPATLHPGGLRPVARARLRSRVRQGRTAPRAQRLAVPVAHWTEQLVEFEVRRASVPGWLVVAGAGDEPWIAAPATLEVLAAVPVSSTAACAPGEAVPPGDAPSVAGSREPGGAVRDPLGSGESGAQEEQ